MDILCEWIALHPIQYKMSVCAKIVSVLFCGGKRSHTLDIHSEVKPIRKKTYFTTQSTTNRCTFILDHLDDYKCFHELHFPLWAIRILRNVCAVGRIENQKFWIFSIPQVGPMDAHKYKHIY